MRDHVINKFTLEVACISEATAAKTQQEAADYAMPLINKLIEEALEEISETDEYWKIDRIEIDLGNIQAEDLSNKDILKKIKTQLKNNIERFKAEAYFRPESNKHSIPAGEADLEIIREILLNGDLPWWVNKRSPPSLNELLENSLRDNPSALKKLLDSHKTNRQFVQRIRQQAKPAVRERISTLSQWINEPDRNSSGYTLTEVNAGRLRSWLANSNTDRKDHKRSLIQALLQDRDKRWLDGIELLGILSPDEIAEIRKNLSTDASNSISIGLLNKHSLPQIGFLSVFNKSGGAHSDKTKPARARMAKMLNSRSPGLRSNLNLLSENQLGTIKKLIAENRSINIERKQQIRQLTESPLLMRYDLLRTAAHRLPVEWKGRLEYEAQAAFGGLSEKELTRYNAILLSGEEEVLPGKKLIKKILEQLSDHNIGLLASLNQWIVQEENRFLPENSAETNANEKAPLIVENAGLCLIGNYLPALFNRLGYLKKGQFKTRLTVIRAMSLLQYMATGNKTNPESVMQLNKLLCGMPITDSSYRHLRLMKKETTEADELLSSAIGNWKALKNTSLAGFRESFLQRKGILTQQEFCWTLQVERKGFDMLLNSMPWPYSLIRLSWMQKPIQVEWGE